jgi:spore germination protein KC
MSIVAGVAIDRKDDQNYQITVEVFDLSASGKESAGKSQIVEGEGKTIFEAVRNTKKRLAKKLYFGDIQLVVISEEIARNEGIQDVLDWFMRNEKARETLSTVISQEKTAKEILTASGVDHKIISEEIEKILDADNRTTASTKNIDTFKALNILKGQKETALVLPAVHCTDNQGKKVVEVNGIAIFKADKLQGYLSPEETHYYLFAVDEIKGGILTFPFNQENQDNLSLEISNNKTKKSYSYEENRLKVFLDIKTTAALGEVGTDIDVSKKDNIEKIKSVATAVFTKRMETVLNKVQTEFGCDVFGFGTMIHKKNPALWSELKENWDFYIQTMEVEVRPELVIENTGLMK